MNFAKKFAAVSLVGLAVLGGVVAQDAAEKDQLPQGTWQYVSNGNGVRFLYCCSSQDKVLKGRFG